MTAAPPTAPPTAAPPAGLTSIQGTALTLGALLGTGVISLPAIADQLAGPSSLLAWAALLLVSVPLAATFSALGSRHPDGGGVTTYARLAFGEQVATALGWAFYLTIGVGAPVAAGFAGAYVADATGGGRTTTLLVAGLIILLVALLNWCGIRLSARVQLGIALVIAVVLVVTVVLSLPHARTAQLHPFAPHGVSGVTGAVAALVWAFAGWEIMASLSAEYADPARDIPRAATFSLVVVGVLYLGIAYATVAVLGDAPGHAPLSSLLVLGVGGAARPVMTVVAVLLTVGTMNSYFAGAARLGAALARDGSLPRWLGHQEGREPRRALLLTTGVGLGTLVVMAVTGADTGATLLVTTGTFSVAYLVATAAAVRLLPRGSWARRVAIVSVLASLALVVSTGWPVLVPLGVGAAGVLWSMARRRTRGGVRPSTPTPVG